MRLKVRRLILIDRSDPPADPSHDGNRHRVADRLVARSVGTLLGGFALPGNQSMSIGETLQTLALERGESANEHGILNRLRFIPIVICPTIDYDLSL